MNSLSLHFTMQELDWWLLTCDPPGRAHVFTWGHNLNKLDNVTYQISRLSAMWFLARRFFSCFSFISLCDPRGRPIFGPSAIILINLVEVPLDDAIMSYQISRLWALGFQTRRFFLKFSSQKSIFSLCDLNMQQTRTI